MLTNGPRAGVTRSATAAAFTLVALTLLSAAAASCGKVSQIQAMRNYKEANKAYQAMDYKQSAALYEEALKDDATLIPQAYFYLGNSYDNLWKPSRKGEADNDQLLQKAVANYEKAAQTLGGSDKPELKNLAKLSLQYLVAAYGIDKINDPGKAEPVVQKMIQLDPEDPANYFALAKLYEDAGAYEAAEAVLVKAKEARPNDPAVYLQLAGYYNRQGEFDKTIAALEERSRKEPNNPEAYYYIATYYWDEASRDFRLKEPQKKDFVNRGLEAVDKALHIKPDYMEALTYKNLLLRLEANMEKDPKRQAELIKQAEQLHDRAEQLRKQKAAGVGQ